MDCGCQRRAGSSKILGRGGGVWRRGWDVDGCVGIYVDGCVGTCVSIGADVGVDVGVGVDGDGDGDGRIYVLGD
jgi:hypothetical protein